MNRISRQIYRGWPTGISVDELHSFAKNRLSGFKAFLVTAQRDQRTSELNLSATQVLLAMGIGLCLTGPLIWVFVRYWLFAL
jgi:hypothetical protein